jgi:arabinofuranosyltransferase
MGYFAALVPNTALAKEAGATYWSQGWRYLADFALAYLLVIPLAPLLAWWSTKVWQVWRRHDWTIGAALVAPVLAAVAHAGYVVRAGGDFMHGRLLLPSLFGLLLPVATVILPLDKRDVRHCRIAFAVVLPLVIWAICCALWLRVPYAGAIGSWGIADERGFYAAEAGKRHPITLDDYAAIDSARDGRTLRAMLSSPPTPARDGRWLQLDNPPGCDIGATALSPAGCDGDLAPDNILPLANTVPPTVDLVVARKYIGIIGFLLGPRAHVVDRLGLSDPIAARLRLTTRGRPGHEKLLPQSWVVARFGDTAGISPLPDEVIAAREALSCGDLAALQRAVDEPLTARRFLENIRLSFSLSHLRIPVDPLAARTAVCSPR